MEFHSCPELEGPFLQGTIRAPRRCENRGEVVRGVGQHQGFPGQLHVNSIVLVPRALGVEILARRRVARGDLSRTTSLWLSGGTLAAGRNRRRPRAT